MRPEGAAPRPREDRPPGAGPVEKGGLASGLDAVGLTRRSRIGFGDEMRVGLRGTPRRVWGRRGIKVRQRLQLKYEWRYLFAAVDGQAGRVWWNWGPSMKAEALWPTIAGIQEDSLLEGLVWDHAPSHRDDEVTDLDLAFVGLPPYSPELNPAERLFEEIRRHVEGRAYATLDAKAAEVQTFLEELDADPPRVRRLCGWDWINAAIASLPEPLEIAA
ncbi:MAG TPA: transposase [Longimicrobiaceae bacterium]